MRVALWVGLAGCPKTVAPAPALAVGAHVHGAVTAVTDYGAFVDVNGVVGLVHVTDLAWGRLEDPLAQLVVGQSLDLVVLAYDPATQRLSLGRKQLAPDPWDAAAAKYVVGSRVAGTVTSITDYGAFVEVEPGVEGLIHVTEIGSLTDVRSFEPITAVVLAVHPESRILFLGDPARPVSPSP